MKIISTITEFSAAVSSTERPLGLVPTMGFLHAGHVTLMERAREENMTLAASIFVNPAQFEPTEDFYRYPRDLESDKEKLKDAGVDLVFTPSLKEIYPPGFATHVGVDRLTKRLEGKARPRHFRGVATVVCKLLSITRPDRAYFGQKDAQQCLVVKKLNADLNLGSEIVVVPTVREPDGLALSSRNSYLGPEERKAANVLYRALSLAEDLGTSDASKIRRQIRKLIKSEPLAEIDYISVADVETLDELEEINGIALVSLAVRIGGTRLIDNVTLKNR